MDKKEPSEKRDIRLYLDERSIESLQAEAERLHVSFSAWLRIMGRFFQQRIYMDAEFVAERERIREIMARIILEEGGKV
jgi:hypothetical protein